VLYENSGNPQADITKGTVVKTKEEGQELKKFESILLGKKSLAKSLSSRDFKLMFVMFMTQLVAGLVLASRLSNMVSDLFGKSADEAATIVSINGGFNTIGRLIYSGISDYRGRKPVFMWLLATQAIVLACLPAIIYAQNYAAFLFAIWYIFLGYGGGFGTIPSFLADMFGSYYIGAVHGVILIGWSIASVVGGLVFTTIFNSLLTVPNPNYNSSLESNFTHFINTTNSTQSMHLYSVKSPFIYAVNLWWLFCVVVIGFLCSVFIRPHPRDQVGWPRKKSQRNNYILLVQMLWETNGLASIEQ